MKGKLISTNWNRFSVNEQCLLIFTNDVFVEFLLSDISMEKYINRE